MSLYANLIEGIFLKRLNRFVCKVLINGKETLAYLPNPGRLWNLLLKGRKILLIPNNKKTKLPYILFACEYENFYVLLHTHYTNKIIKNLIKEKRIPGFENYKVLKEEVKIFNSRFDLILENIFTKEKKILEIKTCTYFGKEIAMFPDAVTKRGTKHLKELAKLNNEKIKGCVLFVIMNPNVKYFLPAYHIDMEFTKTFIETKNNIEFKAISLRWDPKFSEIQQIKEVKIPFSFLEKEFANKGAYLLILNLEKFKKIKIGALGIKNFKPGYYVYVGSAMKNLIHRIKRHRRKNKNLKWHIDYFLKKAKILTDIPIIASEKLECQIAKDLYKICDGFIYRFGSTDCKCKTHLFYFAENPLESDKFQDLILFYRINRLKI
ncbi:DNA/RNA nuclease SfsA [Candidatus Pacearchaeota archaeon]|nr:MAG: DNA/RNA nuclease SfsA [Candidatus Pacearchaeota archaeon]